MTKTQWIGIAVGLIIAGAGGFGLGHWGPSAAVRQIGQYDVMESYAIINQANHELALHHHNRRRDSVRRIAERNNAITDQRDNRERMPIPVHRKQPDFCLAPRRRCISWELARG